MTRRRRLPRLSDRLVLAGTGLRVSPVCVGMVGSPTTIAAAYEAGANFFFITADMHWPLYEASRRGLAKLLSAGRGVRDQVVVAVVCYTTQPEFATMPFLEVIDAVPRLERVDVAVMGGAYAGDLPVRLGVYQEHRRQRFAGITAVGASFHDRRAAAVAVGRGEVDLAFVRYNADHPGARADLFPRLRRRKAARVFNFSSASGFVTHWRMAALGLDRSYWRPRVTDHYRFALMRPELDGLLCAPSTPREVAELAAALESGPLKADEERYLMDLAALDRGRVSLESAGRRAPAR